jgi:hypothetical protein
MFIASMFLPNPHDPWKRPERRWLRCRYLIHHGRRPSTADDDPMTWAAWRYFRGLGHCRDVLGRARLGRRFPAVAEAHNFYTSAEPLARAELEARLLAGEVDEAVGPKVGLSAAAVAAYHALWFSVRPCLQAGGHIFGVVLGGKVRQGMRPDDPELLKVYGYALGARGVDAVLGYLRDPPGRARLPGRARPGRATAAPRQAEGPGVGPGPDDAGRGGAPRDLAFAPGADGGSEGRPRGRG